MEKIEDNEIIKLITTDQGQVRHELINISKLKIGDVVISKHSTKLFMVYAEPKIDDDIKVWIVDCTPIGIPLELAR